MQRREGGGDGERMEGMGGWEERGGVVSKLVFAKVASTPQPGARRADHLQRAPTRQAWQTPGPPSTSTVPVVYFDVYTGAGM
jgi:hypothetical protein